MAQPNFSRQLREARAKAGISQAELAKRAGVSTASIVRWEKNAAPRTEQDRKHVLGLLGARNGATEEQSTDEKPSAGHTLKLYGRGANIVGNVKLSPVIGVELKITKEEALGLIEQLVSQL